MRVCRRAVGTRHCTSGHFRPAGLTCALYGLAYTVALNCSSTNSGHACNAAARSPRSHDGAPTSSTGREMGPAASSSSLMARLGAMSPGQRHRTAAIQMTSSDRSDRQRLARERGGPLRESVSEPARRDAACAPTSTSASPIWASPAHPMQQVSRLCPTPSSRSRSFRPATRPDTWDNVWSYTTIPSVPRDRRRASRRACHAELLRRGADGNRPAEPEEIGPDGTLRPREHRVCLSLAGCIRAQTHLARA